MIMPQSMIITASIPEFCAMTGLGQTLVREMIKDGRLKSCRMGKKKLLVIMQSYFDLLAKQTEEGVPEYTATEKAILTRLAKRL